MLIWEMPKLNTLEDEYKRISMLLAIHCAPVLAGVKAANMMTVTRADFSCIKGLLKNTGISCCFRGEREKQGIVYLYRESTLDGYVRRAENLSFLREYGYETANLGSMLDGLWDRIRLYREGKSEFPHEIGIFLEYPLLDVQGFVENGGRNYLFAGYWKVYQDAKRAAEKFRQYDRYRQQAVQAVTLGSGILEIVEEYRGNYFWEI
ncbi:MAG: DUF3793 family protein [Lachnospiraceae bacterium]|nr:DUF3793 family protein [Lachnospiraceae bacterium]